MCNSDCRLAVFGFSRNDLRINTLMVMADLAMGFALTLLTTVRTKALLRIVASSKANARLANGLVDPPPMLDRRGALRARRIVPEISRTKKLFLRFALLSRPAASFAALGPVARYDA